MFQQPLFDRLAALRLPGFRQALEEQAVSAHYAELTFEERLSLLVDREWQRRENARLARARRAAHLPQTACIEDLDLSPARGLDRRNLLSLAQGDWIRHHLNLLILGPTGAGKSYLACALGEAACRQGFSVRYLRTSRLLGTLAHAHADGSYPRLLDAFAKVRLLVLDDWLRDPLSPVQARDLLEILDDRYGQRSTLVAAQLPVTDWHQRIADPTLADALLDRLVHNAHRVELKGESQRKRRSPLAQSDHLTI